MEFAFSVKNVPGTMRRPKATSLPFKLLEEFDHNISNGNLTPDMVCDVFNFLKANGRSLDENLQSREQLDYYFNEYRNLIRSSHLDLISKCYLLQLIELRAMRWIPAVDADEFYTLKLQQLQEQLALDSGNIELNSNSLKRNLSNRLMSNCNVTSGPTGPNVQSVNSATVATATLSSSSTVATGNSCSNSSSNNSNTLLGSTLKSLSVSNNQTTGSNYTRHDILKDELMIRNADSGKVMGIRGRRVRLIEELSDTIISFQRVNSGARDRLLQITGSSIDAIEKAKKLIIDTIRRNASPVAFDSIESTSQHPHHQSSQLNRSSSKKDVTFNTNSRNVSMAQQQQQQQPQPQQQQQHHQQGSNCVQSSSGKGIQRSSSLGHALTKKDYMMTETVDTGNSDEILKISSNSCVILSECIQVLTSHFELKKSMKRYLPDFEFEESFSSEESDFEDEIRRNRQRHSTSATSPDLDSLEFTTASQGVTAVAPAAATSTSTTASATAITVTSTANIVNATCKTREDVKGEEEKGEIERGETPGDEVTASTQDGIEERKENTSQVELVDEGKDADVNKGREKEKEKQPQGEKEEKIASEIISSAPVSDVSLPGGDVISSVASPPVPKISNSPVNSEMITQETEAAVSSSSEKNASGPLLTYDKQFLLDCSKSQTSQALPSNFDQIKKSALDIIKQ